MYDWPDNGNSTERHKADRRPRSDQHGQRTNNNTLSLSGLVNESIATVEGTVTLPTGHGVLEECQNDRKKSKKKKKHTGCFTNDDLLQPAGTPAGPNIRREGGHNATSPCGANICLTSREVTPPPLALEH